ncbi:MAG: radical SAM protein [Myxococcales bacterium]|nr:radical SAM protein [Myxococcales bacterium]
MTSIPVTTSTATLTSATITLSGRCTNQCVFCGFDDAELATSVAERLAALRMTGAREVTLSGGEPTLEADSLVDAVAQARAAGFERIVLQTNGHALSALAPALAGAGLTDVHLSLHGPDPGSHDHHTGRAGSFERLWEGAASARAARLRLLVTTLVTRSSYRVLNEVPLVLLARGVAGWHLALPIGRGAAERDFARVHPRLALAVPFALHAIEVARRLGLPAYVSGAPRCLLGAFAARSIVRPVPMDTRAFAPRCDGCGQRTSCVGVDAIYLRRFGGDELRPLAPGGARGADDEPLARGFTGVGSLASPLARGTPRGVALPVVR